MNDRKLRVIGPEDPDVFSALCDEWRSWQQARGLARRTIDDRIDVMRRVPDQLGLTPRGIDSFLNQPHLAIGSRRHYHSAIRAWCSWLIHTERRIDDPTRLAPPPKPVKGVPRALAEEHVDQLLIRTSMYRRTRSMILLGLLAGLRVSEIANIRGENFDLVAKVLMVKGKGSKERDIPLHVDLIELATTMPTRGHWFRSPTGNTTGAAGVPVLSRSVSTTVSKVMRRAGLPRRLTPHSLRHTFATVLIQAGADIRTVQELMGHEGLDTTAIYTKIHPRQCREAIDLLPRVPATWMDVSKPFPFEL